MFNKKIFLCILMLGLVAPLDTGNSILLEYNQIEYDLSVLWYFTDVFPSTHSIHHPDFNQKNGMLTLVFSPYDESFQKINANIVLESDSVSYYEKQVTMYYSPFDNLIFDEHMEPVGVTSLYKNQDELTEDNIIVTSIPNINIEGTQSHSMKWKIYNERQDCAIFYTNLYYKNYTAVSYNAYDKDTGYLIYADGLQMDPILYLLGIYAMETYEFNIKTEVDLGPRTYMPIDFFPYIAVILILLVGVIIYLKRRN